MKKSSSDNREKSRDNYLYVAKLATIRNQIQEFQSINNDDAENIYFSSTNSSNKLSGKNSINSPSSIQSQSPNSLLSLTPNLTPSLSPREIYDSPFTSIKVPPNTTNIFNPNNNKLYYRNPPNTPNLLSKNHKTILSVPPNTPLSTPLSKNLKNMYKNSSTNLSVPPNTPIIKKNFINMINNKSKSSYLLKKSPYTKRNRSSSFKDDLPPIMKLSRSSSDATLRLSPTVQRSPLPNFKKLNKIQKGLNLNDLITPLPQNDDKSLSDNDNIKSDDDIISTTEDGSKLLTDNIMADDNGFLLVDNDILKKSSSLIDNISSSMRVIDQAKSRNDTYLIENISKEKSIINLDQLNDQKDDTLIE